MKLVNYLIILAILFLAPTAQAGPLADKLNGTWMGDDLTITFDFPNGKYTAVGYGTKNVRPLKLVEEKANYVIFQTDEYTATVHIQKDGTIRVAREGGLPFTYEKFEE